jgi:hypothetical protein
VAAAAARDTFAHPSYWLPALLLLAPTLVLQLTAPTYLRTRLAPAQWTVALGAVVLIWLSQVAAPAACALVAARRAGMRRTLDWPLVRLSLVIGTRVTLGFAAALVPGFWLQARYAFAPLLPPDAKAPRASRGLVLAGVVALVASALGQSAIAALAESMNTIVPIGQVNGRTVFELHLLPHVATSIAAYVWNAGTLTFQAVCVSLLFEEARVAVALQPAARVAVRWLRAAQVTGAVVALGALIAAAYKFQQHL